MIQPIGAIIAAVLFVFIRAMPECPISVLQSEVGLTSQFEYVTMHGYSLLLRKIETLENKRLAILSETEGGYTDTDNGDSNHLRVGADLDPVNTELVLVRQQLGNAVLVDFSDIETRLLIDDLNIGFGSTVTLSVGGSDQFSYTLFGPTEAKDDDEIISFRSPLGELLMGRKVGDKVILNNNEYDIDGFSYDHPYLTEGIEVKNQSGRIVEP